MADVQHSLELKQNGTGMKDYLSFMQRLSEEIGRLFRLLPFSKNDANEAGPRIRVVLRPNELIFRANLHGLQKEDLKVQIDDRLLIIQGQPQEKREDQHGEVRGKSFCRCLELPESVNSHDAHATFREGVLEVTMPLG
jgi:HSP20 family molecular chaperone IbpA